jgi:hypothetical protein
LAAYRGSSLNLIESICTKKPSHWTRFFQLSARTVAGSSTH